MRVLRARSFVLLDMTQRVAESRLPSDRGALLVRARALQTDPASSPGLRRDASRLESRVAGDDAPRA